MQSEQSENVYPEVYAFPATENSSNGLSKRELIAAMALAGLLGNSSFQGGSVDECASVAVNAADALLIRLSR